MGYLTEEQLAQVRQYLEKHDLTHEPLQIEMLDHLSCDIEMYMQQGLSFDVAWKKVRRDIPEKQFKHIQNETMELLNRKPKTTDIFMMLSFFLLIAASVFKMMHLAGAGILLLSAFAAISITMLLGASKNFFAHAESKGKILVLFIVVLIIMLITSIAFKVLHLPGADMLRNMAVIFLILLFPAISIYFFRAKHSAEDHHLIILLDKYRNKIELYMLALIGFATIFKLFSLLSDTDDFVSTVFLILVLIAAGMFYFSITWREYVVWPEETKSTTGLSLLIFSILTFALWMLPALGTLIPEMIREVMIWGAYLIISVLVIIYYLRFSDDNHRAWLVFFSFILALFPMLLLAIKTGMMEEHLSDFISQYLYNFGVGTGLVILLTIFYKQPFFRAFVILILAMYVYSYPVAPLP